MEEALNVKTMWTIWEWLVISWLPLGPFLWLFLSQTESSVQNELGSRFMCRIIHMIASRTKDTDVLIEGVCHLYPRSTLSDTRLFICQIQFFSAGSSVICMIIWTVSWLPSPIIRGISGKWATLRIVNEMLDSIVFVKCYWLSRNRLQQKVKSQFHKEASIFVVN